MHIVPPHTPTGERPTLTESERLRIRMALLIVLEEIGEPDATTMATALSYQIAPTINAIMATRGLGDA